MSISIYRYYYRYIHAHILVYSHTRVCVTEVEFCNIVKQ